MRRATEPLVTAYALLLSVCLFLWPIVLGFEGVERRVLWIVVALIATLLSIIIAQKNTNHELWNMNDGKLIARSSQLIALLVAPLVILIYARLLPFTFFGDEALVALPTFKIAWSLHALLPWPILIAGLLADIAIGIAIIRYLPSKFILIIPVIAAVAGIAIALMIDAHYGQFIRYPPLVHLFQFTTTILTFGNVEWIRAPVALWSLILVLGVLYLSPKSWNNWIKAAIVLGILLTPLGWTYRILLYQAAGEIVLGIFAVLFITRIFEKEKYEVPLGMTLALWCLQRPTALALVVGVCALLFLMKKRREAMTALGIALPIGLLWIFVYQFGSFQYEFLSTETERSFAIVKPLRETALRIPAQLGIAGMVLLIIGSLLIFWKGDRSARIALFFAWALGVANTVVHAIATIDVYYGYGRFNALLILPFAFTLAGLFTIRIGTRRMFLFIFSILCIFSILETPWNLSIFFSRMRMIPPEEIWHTVTGGALATKMPEIIWEELHRSAAEDRHLLPMVIAPDYQFLDLAIAQGLITPEERTAIIERGKSWTPDTTERPIIIQAPAEGATFTPNNSVEIETHIKEAATWALTQENIEEIYEGVERTIIVR